MLDQLLRLLHQRKALAPELLTSELLERGDSSTRRLPKTLKALSG
jgi:hypothetical protein